jgi:hypothetical protein
MFDINTFLGNIYIEGGNKRLAFGFRFRLVLETVETGGRHNSNWGPDQGDAALHFSAHVVVEFEMHDARRKVLDGVVRIEKNPGLASDFLSVAELRDQSLFGAVESSVVAGIRV